MNPYFQSALAFALIVAASVYATQVGWLGPYGLPNDIYHLLILVFVAFMTYLIFAFTILRRGDEE